MRIDGKIIAAKILSELKAATGRLRKKNIFPHLAIIIVGNDPASLSYVDQKKISAEKIGARTTILHLPDNVTESELINKIREFNQDNHVHGIIVQQPLPQNINTKIIAKTIDQKKDVDGFHPDSHFQMPIAMALLRILEEVFTRSRLHLYQGATLIKWLKANQIVVVGKGETGGKPIIQMFGKMKIPFALIDSKTKQSENLMKTADIIISAVGKKNVIKPQTIRRGVVLISIGISRGESAKLMGDYDQNRVKNIASFYTPTPGGIGPINVAMLLKNTIIAASK